MSIQITRKDIVWSYAAFILQTGANLFILPIILNKLPTDELAIWYVFLSIGALVNLLDFGLQPTITRNISYIFSGAQSLVKEGIVKSKISTSINYPLLKTVIKSVRQIYRSISLIMGVLLVTFGTSYIKSISAGISGQEAVMTAWYIFIAASVFNFYYYYYTPLLIGCGKVANSNQTIVFSKLVFLFISLIGIYLGYGLVAVAFGNLIGSFVNRITSRYFFYDRKLKAALDSSKCKEKNIFGILWNNAYKMGLVSVGAFLITKGNTLIIAKYLPLDVVASYGLTIQIINLLGTVSSVFFRTHLPVFSRDRMLDNTEGIIVGFSKSMLIMSSIFLLGGTFIILAGDYALNFIGSNANLLPKTYILILITIIYLENFHSSCATLITTKNVVPFVKSSLVSGIGVLSLSLISIKILNLGVLGVISSQGIVQLSYNNWKWPYEVLKDLNIKLIKFIKIGFAEMINDIQGKLRK